MYAVVVVVTRDWHQTSYVSLKLYANIKGTEKSVILSPKAFIGGRGQGLGSPEG